MKTTKQITRLKKIHKCIKSNCTGTPKEFAKKLNISESQLYNILEDLKIRGFPIIYSRNLKTYRYKADCELIINYTIQLITNDNIIQIVKE